jgi:hypothetical protein
MGRKKSRQTFEKMKREQRVRERRERKEERKEASRIAKALPPRHVATMAAGKRANDWLDRADRDRRGSDRQRHP